MARVMERMEDSQAQQLQLMTQLLNCLDMNTKGMDIKNPHKE